VCPDLVPQQRMEEDPHLQTRQRESYSFLFQSAEKRKTVVTQIQKSKIWKPRSWKVLHMMKLPFNFPLCINVPNASQKKSSSRVTLIRRDTGSKSHLQKRMWICMQQIKRNRERVWAKISTEIGSEKRKNENGQYREEGQNHHLCGLDFWRQEKHVSTTITFPASQTAHTTFKPV
jgi:hypothetical protein